MNLLHKLSVWKEKFYANKHMRVGVPFIITMCVAPSLMEKFVEIQFMFGKTGNVDKINEEIMKKHVSRKTQDQIIQESYKEMIENRRDFLEQWEPVRVNRSWEERDDTFRHYVTLEDLRLKD